MSEIFPALPPANGVLNGKTHVLPMRVYYEDTDFSGVVYHANYLKFFERGRTEFLRALGAGHADMASDEDPMAFVVVRMEIDFKRPARIDDTLRVETQISKIKGPRVFFSQTAFRDDDELLCRAEVMVVAIGMVDGRPRRLPPDQATKWAEFVIEG